MEWCVGCVSGVVCWMSESSGVLDGWVEWCVG